MTLLELPGEILVDPFNIESVRALEKGVQIKMRSGGFFTIQEDYEKVLQALRECEGVEVVA